MKARKSPPPLQHDATVLTDMHGRSWVDCTCGFTSGPHRGTAAEWQAGKAAEQHRLFAQHNPRQHDPLSVRVSDDGEYQGFCTCGYTTLRASSTTVEAGLDAHLTEMGAA